MRSQQDPHFSDLCDRIGRGKITEEDIKHLKTMVRNTDSENLNENFKNGNLSIIVTTNRSLLSYFQMRKSIYVTVLTKSQIFLLKENYHQD